MTDDTPEERLRQRNEQEAEVEGHRIRHRSDDEQTDEAGRFAMRDDEDAGPDVEGHKTR